MRLRRDHLHARGQFFQARQRLRQRGVRQVILAEEVEQLGAQPDAGVELRIRARNIGAELDQVFGIAVGGQRAANLARRPPSAPGVAMALVRRLTECRISMAG